MKRRGFLGFLGGAAVAGPSMAKQAVAATIADLNVAGLVGGIPTPDWGAPTGTMQGSYDHSWQIARLAKLALRTAAQHEWHRRRTGVHALDPDLAGYRSFAALGANIRKSLIQPIQRGIHSGTQENTRRKAYGKRPQV